ncbi:transcriptional regulator, LacI family [Catenulispora acidiphila DSM 44928]|uniref:Transcriptional regulator, LacI family n=1 Tax=Catenulispora acidiphila (strain DSM 44928 / JCM 14897 / NBRC 102108 / NRRL B-24433 / ID139908) TaxID=479433 RepID=C7Q4U0_CATAD|nr:LacI family DNA-binding transcriptional regulator [Catenulispora acidiphila]ACU73888.1 transcriptional regulator, LacI family [Catenulispora acidiphila DSM 44928]
MSPAPGGNGAGGRAKRPTMVDVAREAGVALRTVSRVVNDDPTVGPEYVTKVRAAIAALNFRPDERARQLRTGITGTIGAAVRRIAELNPALAAIEQSARASRLTLLASSTDFDASREHDILVSMCRQRLDGIIVEPFAENHAYLQPEIEAGMPMVAMDRPMSGVAVDCVMSDNASGIGMAFHHLHQHGHRRIAYIGDSERVFSGHERASAFRAALVAHGQSVTGLVHPGDITGERVGASLEAALGGPDPATALVTGNMDSTIAVLRRLGPQAASRLAIVGFDEVPLADLLQPALTVVAQDTAAIGRTAVELLRERIADPSRPVQNVVIPVSLTTRGSGEVPAPAVSAQ